MLKELLIRIFESLGLYHHRNERILELIETNDFSIDEDNILNRKMRDELKEKTFIFNQAILNSYINAETEAEGEKVLFGFRSPVRRSFTCVRT
jgi:hypothetical protein